MKKKKTFLDTLYGFLFSEAITLSDFMQKVTATYFRLNEWIEFNALSDWRKAFPLAGEGNRWSEIEISGKLGNINFGRVFDVLAE